MRPTHLTPETPMETLVELAREGSAQAFELLMDRQRIRLYCTAMRYTRDYDEAADICQEAMERAWERLHTLHEPTHFSRWMEQIVIHLCLDARRRSRRRPAGVVSLDSTMNSDGEDDGAALNHPAVRQEETARKSVLDQEITAHLLRAIDSLPGTLREAAYLRFIEGMRGEEIASRLGIDYEAAKKRTYRATLELRRRLQPLYHELMGSETP